MKSSRWVRFIYQNIDMRLGAKMPDDERKAELLKYFSDYLTTRHKLTPDEDRCNGHEISKAEDGRKKDNAAENERKIEEAKENKIESAKGENDSVEVLGVKLSPEVLAITRGIETEEAHKQESAEAQVPGHVERAPAPVRASKPEPRFVPPPKYISGFESEKAEPSYVAPQDARPKEALLDDILVKRNEGDAREGAKKTFMERIVDEVVSEQKASEPEAERSTASQSRKGLTFVDAILAQEPLAKCENEALGTTNAHPNAKEEGNVEKAAQPSSRAQPEEPGPLASPERCPVCKSELSPTNRMLECVDCGKRSCEKCEVYEKGHTKTNLYFEFHFDDPLCMRCYEKNFTIQKQLAKAYSCYGMGNYTYAYHYATGALKIDPDSKYAPAIAELIEKIEDRRAESQKQDIIWKEKRKMLISMKAKQDEERRPRV